MNNNFDIVKLIEKNPITRLSKDYQNKFLNKIKAHFTDSQQHLFVGSFFCYLNYNSKKDFVIDFDTVWKWLGFTRKDNAKRLLEKYFVKDIDYKISTEDRKGLFLPTEENTKDKKDVLHESEQNSKTGRPTEQIFLSVNTFKKFCLKADTKKADEIHEYYINLEELLHETTNDESDELRNQLQIKNNQLSEKDTQINQNDAKHKLAIKMNTHNILKELMKTKRCVYIAEIEENKLIKVGSSKDVDKRTLGLTKTFGNCIYLEVFDCEYFREAEINILADPVIVKNLHREEINGHYSFEVVQLSDNFNYQQLLTIVKKYVSQIYMLTPAQLLEKQKLDLEQKKNRTL